MDHLKNHLAFGTRVLNPGNDLWKRIVRFLISLPRTAVRFAALPDRGGFYRKMINTYKSNRMSLFLVFGRQRSQNALRIMAFLGVIQYLRNLVLYYSPRSWRGFDVYNREAFDKALEMKAGLVVSGQHLGPQRYTFAEISSRCGTTIAAMTEQFISEGQEWIDRVIRDVPETEVAAAVARLSLLPVEQPTCALKMVRSIKAGGAVMFDLDGNIGVGGEEKTREGSSEIYFLGRNVHVRSGIAYISFRTRAPILPLISVWGPRGRPELHFFDPIVVEEGETQEAFTKRAIELLYSQLEQAIRLHPSQWEMWPHFFRWMTPLEKLSMDELEGTIQEVDSLCEKNPEAVLRIEKGSACVLSISSKNILIDSAGFRFFVASSLCKSIVEALKRDRTIGWLVSKFARGGWSRADVLREIGRLKMLSIVKGT